jgi:hypothetical protein
MTDIFRKNNFCVVNVVQTTNDGKTVYYDPEKIA